MTADERSLHAAVTTHMLLETCGVAALLVALALALLEPARAGVGGARVALALVVALEGCWLHRLYTSAHEAVHRKLIPGRRGLNDLLGQLLLLPLAVPITVFRKIHAFHHGQNRRDYEHAALDTFVTDHPNSRARRLWFHLLWYLGVFAGGYFIHGVVSILLFVCLPLPLARRVSPAFKGWRRRDQLRSLLCVALGIVLHAAIARSCGLAVYTVVLGAPMLVFAWVYSLLVYIYHCRATYGPRVRDNVRSLRRHWLLSWWLLNFNEHVTHHGDPSVPWYRLPAARRELPRTHAVNQDIATIGAAILNLLRGPVIVARGAKPEVPG
ncbi:MAG: fatty acid desaturase [Myxococcales bacterium]|nr:fatty acid desaturase [Myxococcales bacterium]